VRLWYAACAVEWVVRKSVGNAAFSPQEMDKRGKVASAKLANHPGMWSAKRHAVQRQVRVPVQCVQEVWSR